ncbi:hypothetical protein [Botrimarina sp.]|uniref:hypothetical protein n=1 Tax=Botrimarina sp. TaxID=2795802 RepID=UPI0032EDF2DB
MNDLKRANGSCNHVSARRAAIGLLSLASLMLGCSDGRPTRVKASGRVMIDGEPLKHGSVLFVPDGGRPAAGAIDSDGRFFLTCFEPGDGIIPGKYQVQVKGTEPIGEDAQRWHAPMKYANPRTSGIEREVNESTDALLIELTWDGGEPFVERF